MVWLAVILTNLSIVGLAAFVFYMTGSGWAVLILVFLKGAHTEDSAKCPKCGHFFQIKEKEE
jgi:hypothetical protein